MILEKMLLINNSVLEKLKNKDADVWFNIYEEYKPMIISIVLKNLGNKDEAEDVVQNVMASLYENLKKDRLKCDSNLKNYFYTLTINQWRSNLKKWKRNDLVEIDESMILGEIVQDVQEVLYYNEKLDVIIDKLRDKCKELLTERYSSAKKTMDEIARICGFSNARSAATQLNKCMSAAKKLAMTL